MSLKVKNINVAGKTGKYVRLDKPSSGSFSDGLVTLDENDNVVDSIDNLNYALRDITPPTPTVTESDMIIPIDYDDDNLKLVGDPESGVVFKTQDEIDIYLVEKGWVAFKHLMKIYDALPVIISHSITFNIASGVQRPIPLTLEQSVYGWNFKSKQLIGGEIKVIGSDPDEWETITGLGNLTIDSSSVPSGSDPYIDFSISHPNIFSGKDLRGFFVSLSTGQIAVIRDHTNDRLFTCEQISPTPGIGDSASVVRPSTIFRNSNDDTTVQYKEGSIRTDLNGSAFDFNHFTIQNVTIETFNPSLGGWAYYSIGKSNELLERVLIDYYTPYNEFGITLNGRAFQASIGSQTIFMQHCGIKIPPNTGGMDEPIYLSHEAWLVLRESMVYGSIDGVYVDQGSTFYMIHSTIRECGKTDKKALHILNKSEFQSPDFQLFGLYGSSNHIYTSRILFEDGAKFIAGSLPQKIIMHGSDREAVGIKDGCVINLLGSFGGFTNGSDAAHSGVRILGSRNTIDLDSLTDVTGTRDGDVTINKDDSGAGGVAYTYAYVVSNSPITDAVFNILSKV